MTYSRLKYISLAAALVGSSGCHSTQPKPSVEALLTTSSATTRSTLEETIGHFFNSQPVKLADSAFTTSSTVFIERYQSDKAIPTTQRGLTPVDSFTLLLQNKECVLRHDKSKILLPLPSINCKAD
jgi:hypothetical protein